MNMRAKLLCELLLIAGLSMPCSLSIAGGPDPWPAGKQEIFDSNSHIFAQLKSSSIVINASRRK